MRLSLFNKFLLTSASASEIRLPTRKTRALLAYLAVHAGMPQSREHLMALLWSDRGERQARQSLNGALNDIRNVEREHGLLVLNTDRDAVCLAKAAMDIDVLEFGSLSEDHPAQAAEKYAGPFLHGFTAPDPAFEHWQRDTRTKFENDACDVFSAASLQAERQGKHNIAIAFASRLLTIDPLREDMHRRVMLLKSRSGDRAGALRQYETCASILRESLGVTPNAETAKLQRHIINGTVPVRSFGTGESPAAATDSYVDEGEVARLGSVVASSGISTGTDTNDAEKRLAAALRIANARLEEATAFQDATTHVLSLIRDHPRDLSSIFQSIVTTASKLCQSEYAVFFELVDDKYLPIAAESTNADFLQYLHDSPTPAHHGSFAGRTGIEQKPNHIEDVLTDATYSRTEAQRIGKYRSMLGIPLLKDGNTIAVIVLLRARVKPFTESQIRLVETFAYQAMIAIENGNLFDRLEGKTRQLENLNGSLQARIEEQVQILNRAERLRRFLPKTLVDLITSTGDQAVLESHRQEVGVVYGALIGFTEFSEDAEPEDVMRLLRTYQGAMMPIVERHGGTLERFRGEGFMVIFNDPIPCDAPANRAITMALEMKDAARQLIGEWRKEGYELSFGLGISHGYATLGNVGFEDRLDYTAIGGVVNQATRLCGEARPMEILVTHRVANATRSLARLEAIGDMAFRGVRQPIYTYRLLGLLEDDADKGSASSMGEDPEGARRTSS